MQFERIRIAPLLSVLVLVIGSTFSAVDAQDPYSPFGTERDRASVDNEGFPIRMGGLASTPFRPMASARPEGWPGEQVQYEEPVGQAGPGAMFAGPPPVVQPQGPPPNLNAASGVGVNGPGNGPLPPQLKSFEPGQTIARVGKEIVLASEIPGIMALAQAAQEVANDPRLSPAQRRQNYEQLATYWMKIRESLNTIVERKLLYCDFLETVPKENIEKFRDAMGKEYEESVLPELIKSGEVKSRSELDAKMRSAGTSIEESKRVFIERSVAAGWIKQNVKPRKEVPHQELVEYYQSNRSEFEIRAQAKWEHLMVVKSRFSSDEEARNAIAEMGNAIVVRGAPFEEIAKAQSQGPSASGGGKFDWTGPGSVVWPIVDEALFGLPVGQMSQILEDENNFHIVRVLERQEAGMKPFGQVQSDIRDKIKKNSEHQQEAEFKAKVRSRIHVWTIFDEPETIQRISKLPGEVISR